MKTAIFSFVRASENSMVASVRIARYLSNRLGVPVIDLTNVPEWDGKKYDLLIIVNGAYGFCPCLAELATLVKSARQIVWVMNDYSIIPPKIDSQGMSPFRAAFRERREAGMPHMSFWATCQDWQAFTPLSRYVNWNALTFDANYASKTIAKRRAAANDKLLYYGSYRHASGKTSRVQYFDRYFSSPHVATCVSSPAKQFREKYLDPKIEHVGPFVGDFYETIGGYGMGLYIEDRMSHERFHSPANRFYEMLSAGLPMVFQPECGTMMRRAGYNPEPYFVGNAKAVVGMMRDREHIGAEQRATWIKDPRQFRKTLETQIDEALSAQMKELKA